MERAERRAMAMGTSLHVVVWARGAAAVRLADLAVTRVHLLEKCWSRFRPDSELTLLHARAGRGLVPVSADLHRLVATMLAAHAWSEGDVDASVLGSMLAMGYGADFTAVTASSLPPVWTPVPGSGMAGVHLEPGAIGLARGVGLDPGAIGKGLAGDIVTDEIAEAGAAAVLVSLGGDIVTRGAPEGGWRISLRDDRTPGRDECDVLTLTGSARAVATSSTLRRRWAGRHHVVDPRTGSPVDRDIVQASVVTDCGWRAEAGATVALVRGSASSTWLAERGCTAYLLEGATAHA